MASSIFDFICILLSLILHNIHGSFAISSRVDATVSIREEEPAGTYVYQIEDSSMSPVMNNKVKYFLLNDRNYFDLNEISGVLKTKKIIDLEDHSVCEDNPSCCPSSNKQSCVFKLSVTVNKVQKIDYKTIHVIIGDINDNAPHFSPRSINIRFNEGHDAVGTKRSLPMAIDKDLTYINRRIRYRLLPTNSNNFVLDDSPGPDGPTSIYLKLAAPLNAEKGLYKVLYLVAEDSGRRNDTLMINVTIVDRNEFAPVFDPNLQRDFSISEREKPGYVITTLVATDADAPPNNRIRYQLLPSAPTYLKAKIGVNADNGTVFLLQRLDYEQQKRFAFKVVAVDHGGNDEKSAQISLTITVLDWNDNAPEITVDRGAISVLEGNQKFERIATILVSDKDGGDSGRVACRVITFASIFSIVQVQPPTARTAIYALETLRELDREEKAQYNVTIECTDYGSQPKKSTKVIVVNVADKNDCFPSFDRSLYSFWIWENATKGQHLMASQPDKPNYVIVTDPDIIGKPTLYLEDRRHQGEVGEASAFAILQNGTIVTNRLLDSEVRDTYNFLVCAMDGERKQCEEVIVHVKDVNDHRPQFEHNEYTLSIPENSPTHGEVVIFKVTDEDIENRGFKYRLRAPESAASKYFHLKNNRLMLSQALDREKVVHLTFHVVVQDSQSAGSTNFTSTAKILVTVLDRNDNAPMFRVPNRTAHVFNVSYHEPVGARVMHLRADDPDNGENGTVRYKILYTKPSQAQELFGIDADDYLIVCSDSLSSFAGERIELMIRAADQGLSPLESNQDMILRLIDIPPFYQHRAVERRNLLILILGASALFFLLLLIGWSIHFYRTKNTRRRIMHPQRHKVNYNEEQPLGSLRRYSLDLNNELIYHSSKMYYGADGVSADIPGSPNDFYKKKLLSVERASTIDERLSHDSGRGCSIDQDNGSVRKLVNEPRCASILSRSRQTPPILTSMAAPMTTMTMTTSTAPRSASALAKLPNFSTPPVERRNTLDNGLAVTADTLPHRMDIPIKPTICTTTEVWSGGAPNGTTCGKPVKNPYVSMPEITTSYV